MAKLRLDSVQNHSFKIARSMVGCLKYLSTGKWSLSDFKKAFKSKKRERCAPPAPACGLYLLSVKY